MAVQMRAEDHMAVAIVTDQLGAECGRVASCLVRYPLISHRDIIRLSGLSIDQTAKALADLIRFALVHFLDMPQLHAGVLTPTTTTIYAFHSRVAYCMAYAPKLLAAVGRTSLLEAEILRHYLTFGASSATAIQSTIISRGSSALQAGLGSVEFERSFNSLVSAGYAVPVRSLSLAMKKQMLREYLVRNSIREEALTEVLEAQQRGSASSAPSTFAASSGVGRPAKPAKPARPVRSAHSTPAAPLGGADASDGLAGLDGLADAGDPEAVGGPVSQNASLLKNAFTDAADAGESLPRRASGGSKKESRGGGSSLLDGIPSTVIPSDALLDCSGMPGGDSGESTAESDAGAGKHFADAPRGDYKSTNLEEDGLEAARRTRAGEGGSSSLRTTKRGVELPGRRQPAAEPATKRQIPAAMHASLTPSLLEVINYSQDASFRFSREEPFMINFEALLSMVKCEAVVADYRMKYNDTIAAVVDACLCVADYTHKLVNLPILGQTYETASRAVSVERITESVNQLPLPESVQRAAATHLSDIPAALSQSQTYSQDAGLEWSVGRPSPAPFVMARGDAGMYTQSTIYQYLQVLASPPAPLVCIHDPSFCDVQVGSALRALQVRILDQLLERRHGPGAVRVIRLLRLRGNLEPQTVASEAMLPLSAASALLMSMHQEGLLRAFQLPKTADYNPEYTTYLYGEDPEYCSKLTEVLVKIIYNVWQKISNLHTAEETVVEPHEIQTLRTQRAYLEYTYARLLDIGIFFL